MVMSGTFALAIAVAMHHVGRVGLVEHGHLLVLLLHHHAIHPHVVLLSLPHELELLLVDLVLRLEKACGAVIVN